MSAITPAQPRPYRVIAGVGAGAGAALAMLLCMAALRLLFGFLTIPELMLNTILRVMGGQAFSDQLDRLYYAGRPLLFASILEGTLLLGVVLGVMYAWLARPDPMTGRRPALFGGLWGGALYGLVIGVLLNTVFLPLVGQPVFTDQPYGLYSTSGIPLWLGLMVLALVFGLVLHALLPPATSSFFSVAVGEDGEPASEGRRSFLRIVGGAMLALVGGAAFTYGGTILVQGGTESPVDRKNLADGNEVAETGTQADPNATVVAQADATSATQPRPTATREPSPTNPPPTEPPPTEIVLPPTEEPLTPTPEPLPTSTPEPPPTTTPEPLPTDTPAPAVPVIKVSEITPVESFYHVSKNFFDPDPNAAQWQLNIEGMVLKPYSLTYKQLIAMPAIEVVVGMMCISNPIGGGLIGNTRWKGVRLADLIQQAAPKKGVVEVAFSAVDGYTDSITYQKALDPDVALVWEMGGATLTPEHGYPARLLIPGIYGMKHVKWITKIELVNYDFKGFWQQPDQGWSDPAPVHTMSRIDFPAAGTIKRGMQTLSGIAFAGDRSISKVEVSVDGGQTWAEAYVKPKLSDTSWVVWAYEWTPPGAGKYTVKVRATDGQGDVQPAKKSGPYPNGATGHHTVTYTVK